MTIETSKRLPPTQYAPPRVPWEDYLPWALANEFRSEWVDGEIIEVMPTNRRHQRLIRLILFLVTHHAERQRLDLLREKADQHAGNQSLENGADHDSEQLGSRFGRRQRCGKTIEDTQDLLREGPSLDAYRTGSAVGPLSLLEQRQRWPNLAEFLDTRQAMPFLSAFPMMPESRVLGVLMVHQQSGEDLALSHPEAQRGGC